LKLPWSHRISNRAKANHDATFQFAITQWATPVQAGVVNGVKGAIHVKTAIFLSPTDTVLPRPR
jgi:hypothetical protein